MRQVNLQKGPLREGFNVEVRAGMTALQGPAFVSLALPTTLYPLPLSDFIYSSPGPPHTTPWRPYSRFYLTNTKHIPTHLENSSKVVPGIYAKREGVNTV